MHGSAHDRALFALGITNARGDLQDVTATGALDEERIKRQIAEYARTHNHDDVVNTMIGAFGVQGGRYAGRYTQPDAIERENRAITGSQNAMSVQAEQQSQSEGTLSAIPTDARPHQRRRQHAWDRRHCRCSKAHSRR